MRNDVDLHLMYWDGEDWRQPLDGGPIYVWDLVADADRLCFSGWIPSSKGPRRSLGWLEPEKLHELFLPDSLFQSRLIGIHEGTPLLRRSGGGADGGDRLYALRAGTWKALNSTSANYWWPLKCLTPDFVCAAQTRSEWGPNDRFQLVSIRGDSVVARSIPMQGSLFSGVSREDGDWILSQSSGVENRPVLRRWWSGKWTEVDLRSVGTPVVRTLAGDAGILLVQCFDPGSGGYGNYEVDPATMTLRPSSIRTLPSSEAIVDVVEWADGRVVAGEFSAVNQVGSMGVAYVGQSGCAPLGRGEAPDHDVRELEPAPDGLWSVGSFSVVGSLWSPGIARWDGAAWFAPPRLPWEGSADLDFDGHVLRVFRSGPIVPGLADTLSATWNGIGWEVETFESESASWRVARAGSEGGRVFAAGTFPAGAGTESVLAQLENDRWRVVSGAPQGRASCLAVPAWGVIVGGALADPGASAEARPAIGVYRAGSWRLVDGPFRRVGRAESGTVEDVAAWGDLALIAGHFDFAGESYSPGIVAWDGVRFLPFAQAESGDWHAVQVDRLWIERGSLHASGRFVDAIGVRYSGLYRWTGDQWIALGDPSQSVTSIAVFQDHLYAGLDCCPDDATGYLLESGAPLDPGTITQFPVGLSVEPNPVRDGVRVRFSGPIAAGARWSIVDVAGRRRAGGSVEPSDSVPRVLVLDRARMDRAGITGGVYFVRLEQGGRSVAATMVVLR
ncbi:MAG: hypothetical protein IT349_10040 [Candidatus Eisenbacteria bacterium]|nr:hypothetical protein [Candidatus Eisenbacteria bacterium]